MWRNGVRISRPPRVRSETSALGSIELMVEARRGEHAMRSDGGSISSWHLGPRLCIDEMRDQTVALAAQEYRVFVRDCRELSGDVGRSARDAKGPISSAVRLNSDDAGMNPLRNRSDVGRRLPAATVNSRTRRCSSSAARTARR